MSTSSNQNIGDDAVKINNSNEELEEIIHFERVINVFRSYKERSLKKIQHYQRNFENISEEHKKLLLHHNSMLQDSKICIEQNHAILKLIADSCGQTFENREYEETDTARSIAPPTEFDMDKVRSILKHIVRDWSSEGALERKQCYGPIINEVSNRLKPGENTKVLVPGCGLARLAWEFARLGYHCQGNEFSFYMLFTANFILNKTPSDDLEDFHKYTIHPYIHQRCNVVSWNDTLKPVKFPDVNPNFISPETQFSMGAGDFLDVYKDANTWNCVACCYFIDTAHNILQYIQRIYHILVPGGYWINMGPLLYHYSDMAGETSIELSFEEVIFAAEKIGFKIIKSETNIPSQYTNNIRSMLQYQYYCGLIVAQKPI